MTFMATCSRGFEKFVLNEIKEKLGRNVISEVLGDGKVFFSFPLSRNCSCELCLSLRKCVPCYQTIINVKHSDSTPRKCIVASGLLEEIFNLKLIERICLVVLYKKMGDEQIVNLSLESLFDSLKDLSWKDVLISTKIIRSFHSPSPWVQCIDPENCFASEIRRKEKCSRKPASFQPPLKKRKLNPNQSIPVTRSDAAEDCIVDRTEQDGKENTTSDRLYLEGNSYRVSCRLSGSWKKHYKANDVTHQLITLVSNSVPDWTCNQRASLDIYANLTDVHFIIAPSLSEKTLSMRPYMAHIPLRSTICHLILRLADIKDKFIILDPMCGAGSLLLEAAFHFKNTSLIANDFDPDQLRAAQCNLRNVVKAEFLLSDASSLPLRSHNVDVILCDFPFGKKHQLHMPNLMTGVLKESARVVKHGGTMVFLISAKQKTELDTILLNSNNIELESAHFITIGFTEAYICILRTKMNL